MQLETSRTLTYTKNGLFSKVGGILCPVVELNNICIFTASESFKERGGEDLILTLF